MNRKNRLIFVLFLFSSLISFHESTADELSERFPFHADVRIERTEKKSVKECLLPKKHPLQKKIGRIFRNVHQFESQEALRRAGFTVLLGHRDLLVGRHPSVPGYLFKKFTDNRSQKAQLQNFLKRIEGARIIDRSIRSHRFIHVTVPKKWLYELPEQFTKKYGSKSYILIVEDMNIYPDAEDPNGDNSRLYYTMNHEILTELCTILHEVGGCDAYPRNQPFTRAGKIAFVDTEHVGEKKEHFFKHILPALNPEMQQFAVSLWNLLEKQKGEKLKR